MLSGSSSSFNKNNRSLFTDTLICRQKQDSYPITLTKIISRNLSKLKHLYSSLLLFLSPSLPHHSPSDVHSITSVIIIHETLHISLHTSPVRQRIHFKNLVITYKSINDMAPEYLCELVSIRKSTPNLRSSSQILLQVPVSRLKSYGDCASSVAAPHFVE